jgi:hypothetical protein
VSSIELDFVLRGVELRDREVVELLRLEAAAETDQRDDAHLRTFLRLLKLPDRAIDLAGFEEENAQHSGPDDRSG